jgi:hypothetical protein
MQNPRSMSIKTARRLWDNDMRKTKAAVTAPM